MTNNAKTASFKLEFSLKQQTPMLHFQHEQNGATLRATEVKPKLDSFLIKKRGGKEKTPKDWFINPDKNALNYKLRFDVKGKHPKRSSAGEFAIERFKHELDDKKDLKKQAYKKKINESYFGNMISTKDYINEYKNLPVSQKTQDKKDEIIKKFTDAIKASYKETVFYNESIKMTVICLDPSLRAAIAENIEEFFLVNNFGTRQSKGFGGFIIDKSYEETVFSYLNDYRYFYITCENNTDYKTLLKHARTVYSILKGGLNNTEWGIKDDNSYGYHFEERYIESYIQKTFLKKYISENAGSEKRYFKDKNVHISRKKTNPNRHGAKTEQCNEYYFIRALLGLADQYKFEKDFKGIVYVAEETREIQRFKSPFTIKIIENKIFFLFDLEAVQQILNKKFLFLSAPPTSDSQKLDSTYSISTPKKFDEKDAENLLSGFVDFFNTNAKSKLLNFQYPYNDSAIITLKKKGEN